MKISILAVTIDFEGNDDQQSKPSPVSIPKPFTPDDLIAYLLKEACKSHNPATRSNEPHGPIFKV